MLFANTAVLTLQKDCKCSVPEGLYFPTIFNSLPNDKILDLSNLKAFTDDKISVTQKVNFVLYGIENIMRKGEMLVTSILSFSHNVFKSLVAQGRENQGFFGKD